MPQKPGGLARAAWGLRWLLAVALVLLSARLLARDLAPLRALGNLKADVLIAMALLVVINQWLMAWRFKLIMRSIGAELSHWQWFCLTSLGQFLNLFVPHLGHVHRALVLKRDLGVPYARYVLGMFVFFWLELLASLGLGIVVILAVDPLFRLGPVVVLVPLGAAVAALFAVPALLERWLTTRPPRSTRLRAILARYQPWRDSVIRALGHRSFLLAFMALNVVVAAGHMAMLSLAFQAVGGPLHVGELALFQVLLKLTNFVVITPGNLGLTELAYGVLAQASATGMEHGIAAAVLVRTVGTLMMVALGCTAGGPAVLLGMRKRRLPGDDEGDAPG